MTAPRSHRLYEGESGVFAFAQRAVRLTYCILDAIVTSELQTDSQASGMLGTSASLTTAMWEGRTGVSPAYHTAPSGKFVVADMCPSN